MVRKFIERLYVGRCSITNRQSVFDSVTKRTSFKDVTIAENEPCRLSFSTLQNAERSETTTAVLQSVKLFLRPELDIKSGSKITVTQNGVTTTYASSGKPAVHSNHQEIILILWDEKA